MAVASSVRSVRFMHKLAMLRCRPMLSARAGAGLRVLARTASSSALPEMPLCDFTPQPYTVSFGAHCPDPSIVRLIGIKVKVAKWTKINIECVVCHVTGSTRSLVTGSLQQSSIKICVENYIPT